MKIENNGLTPLSAKRTEVATRVDKKEDPKDIRAVRSGQDKAEMSGNARLLSKARVALSNVEDVNADRVTTLKQQIGSGDYSVQVGDIARKLVAKFNAK